MTESKIMKQYYAYMRDNRKVKVGTYEASKLAKLCGISTSMLLFLGARANATQSPIAITEGWYIYKLDERYSKGEPVYYLTIDNIYKYR